MTASLNTASPYLDVTASALAAVDQSDYGAAAIRYNYVRVKSVKAWLISPLPSVASITTFGISVQEGSIPGSGELIAISYPNVGNTVASVGMILGALPQSTPLITTANTLAFRISTVTLTVPAATELQVIADVSVSFS